MRTALVKKNLSVYLLLLPGLAFLVVFKYAPMVGILIAFQDYNIFQGIAGSPWVGGANFAKLLESPDFLSVFRNTLLISLYKICILFPIPILLAVLFNEVASRVFKRSIQTLITLPHFLSWVVIAGLFINVLSPSNGIANALIAAVGGEPIAFLMDNDWFRSVLVFTAGWKEIGWNSIVFIAAIAGIDPQMYEAAMIDGAGRFRRMVFITLPSISGIIVLMLILRIGNILEAGTEQILMLYNPVVYETGDVIGTYVYRVGLGTMDYSFSTAVGLFNSAVSFILIVSGNSLSRKWLGRSIW